MSRDVAGSYTLPGAVNPVVAGTTITDAWGNQTMNDVAAALTDSLSRSGKGGMTVQLKIADGTASVPSIGFSNETTTGFYRASPGVMRLGVATIPLLEFTAAGVAALLPFAAPTPLTNINTTQVPTTSWVNTFYAPLASPTFTGVVTIPVGAAIAGYALLASPTFTGTVTIPVGAAIAGYATLADPTFTGTVILPPTTTAATSAARRDFVETLAFAAALPAQTGNAGRVVTTNGAAASWTDLKTVGGTVLLGAGDVAFKTVGGTVLLGAGNIALPIGLPSQTGQAGRFLTTDGTNASFVLNTVGDHSVTVHSGNGHGSINNMIRRYTTTLTNVGTAITYADSATLGASFTINETGIYEINTQSELAAAGQAIGISVNSNQPTITIQTISVVNRLAAGFVAAVSLLSVTRVVRLLAGDVIRSHTDSSPTSTAPTTYFSIRKVGT